MKLVSYLVFVCVPSRPVLTSSSSSYLNPPGFIRNKQKKNQLCLPLQILLFLYENLTLILQLFLFRCFIKIVCSVLFQSHLFLSLCRGEEGKVFWCSARTWQTADSNQPGTRVDDDACAVFKRSHLDISCCTWRVNTSRPTTLLANMKTSFFFLFMFVPFF